MRIADSWAVFATACLGFSPVAVALTSCLGVKNAAAQIPGQLVERIQQQSCHLGCEPRLHHWDRWGKEAVLEPLVEDATNSCDIPEFRQGAIDVIDGMFQAVSSQCDKKLDQNHLCAHPERLQPFVDCAKSTVSSLPFWDSVKLLRFASEKNCRCLKEYLTGDQIWEHFDKYFAAYTPRCHEL